MKKEISLILFAVIIGLSLLTGCFGTTESPSTTIAIQSPTATTLFPVTITDQTGRTVTLEALPQRIVSLAPSNTEILFALGLADKISGVTDYCDYPPEAEQKPSIGGFSTPNIEEVVAKNPDLVLAANIHISEIAPQLEDKGLTVMVLNPKNIDEVLEAITLVGQVTGQEAEAEALTGTMQDRIEAITLKIMPLSSRPVGCYVVWHDPLMLAGEGTLQNELIENAGGFNLAISSGLKEGYPDITLESFLTGNPQVIIVGIGMGSGEDEPLQFIESESRLEETSARVNNRIYAIDQDIAGRAGPRIVDALEQFAAFIHLELFE